MTEAKERRDKITVEEQKRGIRITKIRGGEPTRASGG